MTQFPAKAQLRDRMRGILRAVSAEQRAELSRLILKRLIELPDFRAAKNILFYIPLLGEPAIDSALNTITRDGVQAFLPRFCPDSRRYEAAAWISSDRMVRGRFEVPEPDANCRSIPLNQLDFALVPGIAFDLAGRRLGRGKGYYDRLLAEVRGHKCGVAFDAQIVAEVPEGPHDVRVNSILTPTRWHLCQRAA